jgi:hypothetical protein
MTIKYGLALHRVTTAFSDTPETVVTCHPDGRRTEIVSRQEHKGIDLADMVRALNNGNLDYILHRAPGDFSGYDALQFFSYRLGKCLYDDADTRAVSGLFFVNGALIEKEEVLEFYPQKQKPHMVFGARTENAEFLVRSRYGHLHFLHEGDILVARENNTWKQRYPQPRVVYSLEEQAVDMPNEKGVTVKTTTQRLVWTFA